MRTVPLAAVCAAVLVLAACASAPAPHRAPPTVAPPAAPAAVAVNPDAHACWAFHQAITKGVPAGAAGQTTAGWLQSQTGNAGPVVYAAIQRFIDAWQMADPGKIARAQRAVKSLCAALG